MKLRALSLLLVSSVALSGCLSGDPDSIDGGNNGNEPVVTLQANPSRIVTGSASTLTWSASGARSCVASGSWSGEKDTSGSESTGALTTSQNYILTCSGPGGTTQQAVPVTVSDAPPTLTLSASPTSAAPGATITLTWQSTDARACLASGGWTGGKPLSGSEFIIGLQASSDFSLDCSGPGGSISRTVSVTINAGPPAPTVTLAANPTSVVIGNATQLTWSSTNATACTASDGWTGSRATSGSETSAPLNANTNFTLSCTGPGGTSSQTVTVTAGTPPPPPTVALVANPATIASGGTSTLSWSSTNASSCSATGGWSGSKAISGSQTTAPLASSTDFTLSCSGAGGTSSQTVTVTVAPVPTLDFTANPTTVQSGGTSALTWVTTNATACTASGGWSGGKVANGSQMTAPLTQSTTYTLACTGTGGTVTRSVTVAVASAPTLTLTALPVNVANGGTASINWSSTNATSCTASGGWSGTKATSGTETSAPIVAATTFTLTCTGTGGSVTESATVNVVPAPTVTLGANPATVASGASSTLTWSSTNATSCNASDGWLGPKATAGTQTTAPLSTTTTFTLTCTGTGGSASQSVTVTVIPPPTVSLSVTPSVIASGGSSTLAWSATDATSCTASDGWSGTRATSGSESTGPVTTTTTYTLSCTGQSGTASRSVTLTVAPPPTVSLGASPTSIASGAASTLTWSSTNATNCSASGGWGGSKPTSGSQSTGPLAATTTFTLTCIGSGGTAAQSVTVTVVPAPTLTLSASPTSLASGDAATLTWSSTDATGCTASGGWSGAKATSGSQSSGALAATTTFTLSCTGTGGTATQSATVTVVPAPTVTLTTNPTSVATGGSSTLSWSTSNATSCTASGGWSGAKGTSGSQSSGALAATTTFTLSCTGTGGTTDASATVTVNTPAPTVTLTASPTSVTSGGSSTLTWSSTNATSCTASGGWSGAKATSGSQSTGALAASTTFTLSCSGAGGSADASATVTVGAVAGVAFPLHVEAGTRYLVDANGNPFFIHGDTPWALATQLTREEVVTYLENRRLKGFNTILIELMEHFFSTNPPNNAYGDGPFLTPGDFGTPNEAYFAHVDYIVAQAQSRGMLVMITPAYMGFGGGSEGWYQEMVANGATKLRTFGQYVGNRFKAYDNILWIQGGDYNPPEKLLMRAVANGINDATPGALQSFHGQRFTSALAFATGESWLNVNNSYSSESTVVSDAFTEYARSSMPFFLSEGRYEGETTGTEVVARAQGYQAVLSGASGHLYGNNPVWLFGSGWQAALDAPGAATLRHLKSLFDSLAWWTLVPDTGGTLVTSGVGSGTSRTGAARANTGAFALVYMPSSRTIAVSMGQLSGPNVRARWYDPTNGTYSTVAGSPFAASGSRSFTPTGNNSRGFSDWVLVLDSVP